MLNFSIPAANCSRDTFTSQYRNFIISKDGACIDAVEIDAYAPLVIY